MAATSPPRTLLFLALLVSGRRFGDHRGFLETYSQRDFAALGLADVFVQDSHSLSAVAGTV
jgi:dTDP-4-dehydrorhamnose 3,5-epimerase